MSARPINQHRDLLIPFFLLTFLITWGIGALAIFLPAQLEALVGSLTDTSPIYFLAIGAPTISATILTFARGGWSELRSLYARLVRWRFGAYWYMLVLIVIPAVGWIATRFTNASPLKLFNNPAELLLLLIYVLITGPLCEELGWRGYALPRLLDRFNPFFASLILGVIWGVWHLPSFFVGGMVQSGLSLPLFLLNSLLLSFFVTWVFQHTGGSVLATILVHYAFNICASIIGVAPPVLFALLLTTDVLVLVFDGRFDWFRLRHSMADGDQPHLGTSPH